MELIQKEIFCRVGKDYRTGVLFISALHGLDKEIAHSACRQLKVKPTDIHDKTTVIKKFNTQSITGDNYLAEKVLKMKVAIMITECELIDDREV